MVLTLVLCCLQAQSCEGTAAPNCGVHGVLDDVCQCVCDKGWTTRPFQASAVEFCTLALPEGKQQASGIVIRHLSLVVGIPLFCTVLLILARDL